MIIAGSYKFLKKFHTIPFVNIMTSRNIRRLSGVYVTSKIFEAACECFNKHIDISWFIRGTSGDYYSVGSISYLVFKGNILSNKKEMSRKLTLFDIIEKFSAKREG